MQGTASNRLEVLGITPPAGSRFKEYRGCYARDLLPMAELCL